MSGGWAVAVGSKSKNPKLAFYFVAQATNKENSMENYTNYTLDINPRADVENDPNNQPDNKYVKSTTDLVQYTHFRQAYSAYSKVSAELQKATEAVITGSQSVDEAAKSYDEAVTKIVGKDHVIKR